MSTFKKIVSIMLCIAMLAGSFTMLGGLATPDASAADGTSKVKSYESLAAQYDNFIYLASDIYEIETEDGTLNTDTVAGSEVLTDYYVEPGQILEERFYIKGDFYFGAITLINAYDNAFFDVTQVTTTAPNSNGYSSKVSGPANANHPVHISHVVKSALTTGSCAKTTWFGKVSGFSAEELAQWDYIQDGITNSNEKTNTAFIFNSDEWLTSWRMKVKEGLTDGTTGTKFSAPGFWNCNSADGTAKQTSWNNRKGTINIGQGPATDPSVLASTTGTTYVKYDIIDHFLLDDLTHTFTIGANPNAGGTTPDVKKYTVTFLENDGTEISATEYVKDAAVAVPEEVDGQIGWANTATGAIVDLTDYVAIRNIEFKRVLDTDEFEVVLKVNGGEIDEAALPEGAAVNADGSFKMSILKSDKGNEAQCLRYFFEYAAPIEGEARIIHTYNDNGNPIPSFEGEPKTVTGIEGDIDTVTETIWNSLNADNKVSLFVRFVNRTTGETTTKIVNKNV